jgi:hypothetical protein
MSRDDRYGTGNADYDEGYDDGILANQQIIRVIQELRANEEASAVLVEHLGQLGFLRKVFEGGRSRAAYIEALNQLAFYLLYPAGIDVSFALAMLAATLEDLDRGTVGDLVQPTPSPGGGRKAAAAAVAWAQACLVLALECLMHDVGEEAAAAEVISKRLGRSVGLRATTLLTWRERFQQGGVKSRIAQRTFNLSLAKLKAGEGEFADRAAAVVMLINFARDAVPNLADLVPNYPTARARTKQRRS